MNPAKLLLCLGINLPYRCPQSQVPIADASHEYVAMLESAHMKISMSRTLNPYDNAHMESFFKALKYAEVHPSNYETFDDVTQRLPHFFEELYNKKVCIRLWGTYPRRNTR